MSNSNIWYKIVGRRHHVDNERRNATASRDRRQIKKGLYE
jgi:hypothetical protein